MVVLELCSEAVMVLTLPLPGWGHNDPTLALLKLLSSESRVWFGPIPNQIWSHRSKYWPEPPKNLKISIGWKLCKLWRNDQKEPGTGRVKGLLRLIIIYRTYLIVLIFEEVPFGFLSLIYFSFLCDFLIFIFLLLHFL